MCGTEQTVYLSVPMVKIFMFILKDFIGKPKKIWGKKVHMGPSQPEIWGFHKWAWASSPIPTPLSSMLGVHG